MPPPERPQLRVTTTINGRRVEVEVDTTDRLLDLLRYGLGLTGTKEGCGEGECGACTVLLDGLPANACLVPAYQAEGAEITTVESIPAATLRPLVATGATQCGACTPGVAVTAFWITRNRSLLESHTLREIMAGNLCRCTGYDGIIEGVEAALQGDP